MMVVREMSEFDTLDFCRTLNINLERFQVLDAEMKDRRRNPGYSSYTPQLFMSQLDVEEYGLLQEKLYKFPGIYIRNRTERQYNHPNMGLILGYVAEVDQNTIAPTLLREEGLRVNRGSSSRRRDRLKGREGWRFSFDAHGGYKGAMRRERTIKRRCRGKTSL